MYFLIEDHDFFKRYDTLWDKVSTDIKLGPVCIEKSLKTRINLMVVKLQIFMINKFLRWTL